MGVLYRYGRQGWWKYRNCNWQVRDHPLPGIAGSNSTGCMDVCLLWMLYVVQVESSATGWFQAQGCSTECICVTGCYHVHHNTLHLQRVGRRDQTKKGRKKERKRKYNRRGVPVGWHCCCSNCRWLFPRRHSITSQKTWIWGKKRAWETWTVNCLTRTDVWVMQITEQKGVTV